MEGFRDWLYGRAGQKTEIISTVAEQKPVLDYSTLPLELLLQLKEAYATQLALEQGHSDGDRYFN